MLLDAAMHQHAIAYHRGGALAPGAYSCFYCRAQADRRDAHRRAQDQHRKGVQRPSCRFPRSSTVAPTFCTSRVHRTSASSPIFAAPSNRVAIMLSIAKLNSM